ncbi:hypothetical protein H100_08907 [Trichophyton rubrum MR850]|nr:hypothetical protein H100_08907 [Trichophyton rubrum MR850]EZF57926.1 hypothetical protein H104_08838 [Trichophyton rubrum CBS 289.86]
MSGYSIGTILIWIHILWVIANKQMKMTLIPDEAAGRDECWDRSLIVWRNIHYLPTSYEACEITYPVFLLNFWIVRCRVLLMEDGILLSRAWGCHGITESIGVMFSLEGSGLFRFIVRVK